MRNLIIVTLLMLGFAIVPVSAETEYESLSRKAARYFDNGEWANANAMYVLMMEKEPHEVSTYAHAAVVQVMMGDTVRALDLLPRSMSYEVPVDSFFTDLRDTSFSIGHGELYCNYLIGVKKTYPWFSRIADNYLMRYYAFRQNGPELIKYAKTMLAGMPNNRDFLRMLAHGCLLTGDTKGAIDAWLKTVELYPDDYDTVLDLANCYDAEGNKDAALKWMLRASELRTTPYVTARISALGDTTPNTKMD